MHPRNDEATSAPLNTLGPWKMTEILALDIQAKTFIIKELRKNTKKSSLAYRGEASRRLLETVCDKSASLEKKWQALINFCQTPANIKRYTYGTIVASITNALTDLANELAGNNQFDEAAQYIKFSAQAAKKIILKSILSGALKKEYLDKIDFSKKSFIKAFCKNEIIKKTLLGASLKDEGNLDIHAMTAGVSILFGSAARTPISFFSYHGREINDKQKIVSTLLNLSQLSDLLSPEDKNDMLKEIAKQYQSNSWKLSKSYQSNELIEQINGDAAIKWKWMNLVTYMVSEENQVLLNNGTRLFNIIRDVTNQNANGLFLENTLATTHSVKF